MRGAKLFTDLKNDLKCINWKGDLVIRMLDVHQFAQVLILSKHLGNDWGECTASRASCGIAENPLSYY